ncbi:MAG: phosphoenolpyruvate--protein phosphotransferase [Candidatus Asgardarchaeia archaeon]
MSKRRKEEVVIKGVAASPGYAIGKAFLYETGDLIIEEEHVSEDEVDKEVKQFLNAIESYKVTLNSIIEKMRGELGEDKARIFEAHKLILEDPSFVDNVKGKIRNELYSAEYAVKKASEEISEMFRNMESEYMRERAEDVIDIGRQLIRILKNLPSLTLDELREPRIIVAKELGPSDTAQMDVKKVLAYATDLGGKTSHVAILSRSLGIPSVVGLKYATEIVRTSDDVIVDGVKGLLIVNPRKETVEDYIRRREEYLKQQEILKKYIGIEAVTKDGHKIQIGANIGSVIEADHALKYGAEGVGLLRTEFLYLNRVRPPSEDELYKALREIADKMYPKDVIVRTLDIGGDKPLPYIEFPEENNPFLGWRGLRLCLERTDILKTQLRAILRANKKGNLWIMYPMVVSIEEVRKANEILEESKEELKDEGYDFEEDVKVGIMIETPSAAIISDMFAQEVDFFSIGTNDLTQYTLCVDRTNDKVAYLYDSFHPSVLRLLGYIVESAHKYGKWVGICGEMGGDPEATPLLVGSGLDELSMVPTSIPNVKRIVKSISYKEAKEVFEEATKMKTTEEVHKLIDKTYGEIIRLK